MSSEESAGAAGPPPVADAPTAGGSGPSPARGRGRPVTFDAEKRAAYVALLRVGLGKLAAARECGVSNRTVLDWRKGDADFRAACEEAEDEANEPVERALYEAAGRGEPWAVKLWLTNRAGGRWQEKAQVEISGRVESVIEAGPLLADVSRFAAELASRRAALEVGPPLLELESEEIPPEPAAALGAPPA